MIYGDRCGYVTVLFCAISPSSGHSTKWKHVPFGRWMLCSPRRSHAAKLQITLCGRAHTKRKVSVQLRTGIFLFPFTICCGKMYLYAYRLFTRRLRVSEEFGKQSKEKELKNYGREKIYSGT